MSGCVLDASALLAFLQDEPGGDEVADLLATTAVIGAANWAETLSKLAEVGRAPTDVVSELGGVLGVLLHVEPVIEVDAVLIAELRPRTRDLGLGLGDRACLALGARLDLPVVTADRKWRRADFGIDGLEIRSIR